MARFTGSLSTLAPTLLLAVASCSGDALIREFNVTPIAEATVIHPQSGVMVQAGADGSLAPVTFPYAGVPVRLVLDGSGSRDPDGEIREYRWLSGTRAAADAGVPLAGARRLAAGAEAGWPADDAMATVELGPGVWAFTLWVRDDDDAWSNPDTIRVVIGAATPAGDAGAALAAPLMDGGIRAALLGMDSGS